MSPDTGTWRGGYPIVLTGSEFEMGMTVSVGGVDCTDTVVAPDGTAATCILGELSPGSPADIVAINPDDAEASFPQGFTSKIFTYVAKQNQQIVRFELGGSNGRLANETVVENFPLNDKPSRVALHPTLPFLYVLHDVGAGNTQPDKVDVFQIHPETGNLTKTATKTFGTMAEDICVTENTLNIVERRAGSGLLTTFDINSIGTLGSSNGLATGFDPIACTTAQDRFVYALNGQEHTISIYQYNGSADLTPLQPNVDIGGSPITMATSPDGDYLIAPSSTQIHLFQIEVGGTLRSINTPTLTGVLSFAHIAFNPLHDRFYLGQTATPHSLHNWSYNENGVAYLGDTATAARHPGRLAVSPRGNALVVSNYSAQSVSVHQLDIRNGNILTETDNKSVQTPRGIVIY